MIMVILDKNRCLGCGGCPPLCKPHALFLDKTSLILNQEKCNTCKICLLVCPVGAFKIRDDK
jgi:Fe-S-cluster-containing hydrogenase component 2